MNENIESTTSASSNDASHHYRIQVKGKIDKSQLAQMRQMSVSMDVLSGDLVISELKGVLPNQKELYDLLIGLYEMGACVMLVEEVDSTFQP